ncbi:SIR2 family protein [Promicromonospora sp. NPDC050880]|uniref:SIR2 family protein n=1 Tax=Promicromonospora sp. NPDC050880 TaxID=3364406 RepID=UPI0037873457
MRSKFIGADSGPSELHLAISQLGPTCFLTTNYDSLLERALADERPGEHFDVVTPVHRLEIPSIIQARANHFIFKPHGDIGNSDTVVLTREDYRIFQDHRRNVFEATKTLLASRPVIFIGFGLRDPDFLLMRDQLLGTYTSSPADHVAIMPDVHELEMQYWRRSYGIELLSYKTDRKARNPHSPILDLIQNLKDEPRGTLVDAASTAPRSDPSTILSLARFARGFGESLSQSSDGFPLQLSRARAKESNETWSQSSWRLTTADALGALTAYRGKLLIEGAPGSGKSFLVTRVAGRLARQLEAACLDSGDVSFTTPVPVLIQLRDYRGDLSAMLEKVLPVDLSFAGMLDSGMTYLILDGANEIEPKYEESFARDLSQLVAAPNATIIVTTRFASAIDMAADFTTVLLDAVDSQYVDNALRTLSICPEGVNPETRELLRRPLFFAAWKRGDIDLRLTGTVHDVYSQLASRHQDAICARFDIDVSLHALLGRIAHGMVDDGELSASLTDVLVGLRRALPSDVREGDVLDYLIETGLLIATPLKRLAFYHHSVTEYLAASHLARLVEGDLGTVIGCLGRVDWDQSLLLTLGFLSDDLAARVQGEVMRVDTLMGLRALHFLEHRRDEWIAKALAHIPEELGMQEDLNIARALELISFKDVHTEVLSDLSERPNSVGGTAAAKLCDIQPEQVGQILDDIVYGRRDYNYLNAAAALIKGRIDEATAVGCLEALERREREQKLTVVKMLGGREPFVAEISAVAEVIQESASVAVCVRRARSSDSELVKLVVERRVDRSFDPEGMVYLRERIAAGSDQAIFGHYLQLARLDEVDDVEVLEPSPELVSALVAKLRVPDVGRWSLGLLRILVVWAPGTADIITRYREKGLVGALLKYACGNVVAFEEELRLLVRSGIDWDQEPTFALEDVEGMSPDTVRTLISTRHDGLAGAILDALYGSSSAVDSLGLNLSGEIDSYLEWLDRLSRIDPISFPADRLSDFLCRHTSDETRDALLSKFNSEPAVRPLMNAWILPRIRGISADDLSAEATEWILSRAGDKPDAFHRLGTLELIATEEMVMGVLMPRYLTETDDTTRARLAASLRLIGRRHNRRYVGDDDQVVGLANEANGR